MVNDIVSQHYYYLINWKSVEQLTLSEPWEPFVWHCAQTNGKCCQTDCLNIIKWHLNYLNIVCVKKYSYRIKNSWIMSSADPTFVVLTLRDTCSHTLIRPILTRYIIKMIIHSKRINITLHYRIKCLLWQQVAMQKILLQIFSPYCNQSSLQNNLDNRLNVVLNCTFMRHIITSYSWITV